MQDYSYKINRKGKTSIWVILFRIFLVAVAAALCVAAVWQYYAEGSLMPPTEGSSTPSLPQNSSTPAVVSSTAESSTAAVSSAAAEPSSSEAVSSAPALPEMKGTVAASEAVDNGYFADAVFVGDSITEGFTIYTGMENAKILAGTGINLSTVYTSQVIKLEDGTRSTIMDELAKGQYAKVYVMLGGNEVRDMPLESFLPRYAKVLEDVRTAQPNAVIYVQSMTPVTVSNNYNMDNDRIDMFNAAILQMCLDKGYAYLNVAEALKNQDGALPTEASPKDGMHFGQAQFDIWVEYLKTHTLKAE